MVMVRPVAPTQPHLARLRVERQHRLIEELRLAAVRHATAEELADSLRVDVRTVERDIARLREVGVPIAARRGPGGGFRLDVPSAVAPVHLSQVRSPPSSRRWPPSAPTSRPPPSRPSTVSWMVLEDDCAPSYLEVVLGPTRCWGCRWRSSEWTTLRRLLPR